MAVLCWKTCYNWVCLLNWLHVSPPKVFSFANGGAIAKNFKSSHRWSLCKFSMINRKCGYENHKHANPCRYSIIFVMKYFRLLWLVIMHKRYLRHIESKPFTTRLAFSSLLWACQWPQHRRPMCVCLGLVRLEQIEHVQTHVSFRLLDCNFIFQNCLF